MYGFALPTSAPCRVSACTTRDHPLSSLDEKTIIADASRRLYAGLTINRRVAERQNNKTTNHSTTTKQQSVYRLWHMHWAVPCVSPCPCSDPNPQMLRTPLLPSGESPLTLRSPCEWHPFEPQQQSPAASRQRMARCSEAQPRALQGASVPA
jgi:hypothetical protein